MSRIRTGACREDRDAIRRNWPFADKAPQGEPMPARVEQCPLAFGDLTSAHASTLHAIRREWESYEPVSSCGHPGWYLAVFDGQAVRCEIGDCPRADTCIDARRCLARRVDA